MKLKEFKSFLSTDQDMIRIIVVDYCCKEIIYTLNHKDVINFLNNRNDYFSEVFSILRHEIEDMEVSVVHGFNAEGYNGITIYVSKEE